MLDQHNNWKTCSSWRLEINKNKKTHCHPSRVHHVTNNGVSPHRVYIFCLQLSTAQWFPANSLKEKFASVIEQKTIFSGNHPVLCEKCCYF